MVERVRLEDVCDKASSNLVQKDLKEMDGIYPVYGASGHIKDINLYHQDKEYIAIVKDGAGVGRTMYFPDKSSVIGTLQYLLPKENIVPKYLYFVVKAMKLGKYSTGATIPHIYFKDYKKEQFLLPSKEEQLKIVGILEKIEKIILDRQQQIVALDKLIKSQFIKMFGDPIVNPHCWHECLLQDVMSNKASNGFFAKPKNYCEDGNAGIICVGDVVNRKYSNTDGLRRTNADEKQFQKYKVVYGDMLFCRSSLVKDGIAKASIIPKNSRDDLLFECHVIRIPLDINKVIPEFMQAFSTTAYFRGQMMDKSKTATMTTIGQKDIVTGKIFVPPMELQRQFFEFTKQSDKLKFSMQQNLYKLQELFDSLMQQFFA